MKHWKGKVMGEISGDKPQASQKKSIFLAWEKLRIIYNAILAAIVLVFVICDPEMLVLNVRYLVALVYLCVVANVLFFAGPAVEAYAAWLGFNSKALRLALFGLGTIFAGLLAVLVMSGTLLPFRFRA